MRNVTIRHMDPADNDTVRQALVVQGVLIGEHNKHVDRYMELHFSASFGTLHGQERPAPPLHSPTTSASTRASASMHSATPFSATRHEPHVPFSKRYLGKAGRCSIFFVLVQCSLVFYLQLLTYPTDRANIAFIVNLLSGRAVQ